MRLVHSDISHHVLGEPLTTVTACGLVSEVKDNIHLSAAYHSSSYYARL